MVLSVEPAKLLEHLFDKKKILIVRQFLAQPDREWTLQELSKASKVPLATTFRILHHLLTLELLQETKIKHLKTYKLAETAATKYLSSIMETGKSALDAFVEQIKDVSGVEQVILHGKQTKDKANILIIGKMVDTTLIHEINRKILEQYHFTIIMLSLDPNQYEQMVSMGLYSGTKKELYVAPTSF